MANKRDLKAYIRYDGNGRVIPGALLLQRFKPKGGGKWHETPAYECCNDITLALRILFYDIEFAITRVGDITNVDDWNTYFDLPALGNPFTSVEINGNEVKLYGGSNIKIKPALMYDEGNDIIELDDQAGCVTSVGGDAFSYSNTLTTVNLPECTILYGWQDSPEGDVGAISYCDNLVTVNAPKLVTIGDYGLGGNSSLISANFPFVTTIGSSAFSADFSLTSVNLPSLITGGYGCFSACSSLTSISLPSLISINSGGFYSCSSLTNISLPSCTNLGDTVGNDGVFSDITGNNITLTVPSALMTCNAGSPDGDIVVLQSNNTVTVVTV